MCNGQHNECLLLFDIIGLELLVEEIIYEHATHATNAPTSTAFLGPFGRFNAPALKVDESIVHNISDGALTYIHSVVTDYLTGGPIEGAELDVWHNAPNGIYEQQGESWIDFNLRGRFPTDIHGRYNFYCLLPTSYSKTYHRPFGTLLQSLDRQPMPPAHTRLIISAPDYRPVITQVFNRRGTKISDDSVFAAKESLTADFLPREGDSKANFELLYDFRLATYDEATKDSLFGTTEESVSLEAEGHL